jgi:Icc-related predicted phosphoesterase
MTGTVKECQLFHDYVASLPHPHKVVIAGNHDLTLATEWYKKEGGAKFHYRGLEDADKVKQIFARSKDLVYLEDSGVTILGLNFWGSPWQPEFGGWAFNLPRGPLLKEKWDMIPPDTDILITHGPAKGQGGKCYNGVDAGCVDLLEAIFRVQPALHVFGHIHEDAGVTTNSKVHTIFANASTCTLQYRPTNSAIVVDVLPCSTRPGTSRIGASVDVSEL